MDPNIVVLDVCPNHWSPSLGFKPASNGLNQTWNPNAAFCVHRLCLNRMSPSSFLLLWVPHWWPHVVLNFWTTSSTETLHSDDRSGPHRQTIAHKIHEQNKIIVLFQIFIFRNVYSTFTFYVGFQRLFSERKKLWIYTFFCPKTGEIYRWGRCTWAHPGPDTRAAADACALPFQSFYHHKDAVNDPVY